MANLRTIVGYTVPVITALFGLLWYFGKRKPPPDKSEKRDNVNQSDTTLKKTVEELQIQSNINQTEETNVKLENQPQNDSSAKRVIATPEKASVDSGKGASIHEVLPGVSNQELHNAHQPGGNQTYQCNFPTSSKKQIDEALYQISHKFPDVDLSPITITLPGSDPTTALQGAGHPILMPEIMQVIPEDMQLNLPEGVSVDVVVSSIVDAGHIFVQQHTHPSFPSLERLNQFMMACYSTDGVVPQLPRPIEVDVICAAPLMDGWYRAQISCVYEDTDECDVKFVDYGVFSRVPASCLKQIRYTYYFIVVVIVFCAV
ncbi:hypothetical protein KUTeg_010326 [Tegillarca granosa]|uniref:Tudor domain-containing protein n=1 Tax=Tegillarca granosa TaxID=220873 RepID=A0ABQ9F6E8_TEGGR|nr:hypothetical protein KUTeg_010326 [Tegillarca granosa]